MGLNLQETASLKLQVETATFQNDLVKLDDKAKELKTTLKQIEKEGGKGSENWQKYRAELDETTKAATKMRGEVDASQLTYGQLENRVKQLNAELKKLKPGSDEFTAATKKLTETKALYDKARGSISDVNEALHKGILEAKDSTLTYGQLETKIKLLNSQLKDLKPGTDDFVKASKQLGAAEKEFERVGKQVKEIKTNGEDLAKPTLWQKISSGVGIVGKAMSALMALQVIGYIIDIGKSIFETTAKFEKYGKVLETALGSQAEAKAAMSALKDLAKNTAFTVDQLTDGYVKMVNRGIRPSKAEMIALTDLAASQGKEFDQLVEAALDATQGEFERLKEFGIKASKEGDKVKLSFKGMNVEVKNTPEALQGAIVKFGEMNGVAGQNAKMMETLGGQTSNLEDSFDALKVELGEKLRPVFVGILSVVNGAIPVIRVLANVLFTAVSATVSYYKTLMDFAAGAGSVLKNMGIAAKEFLSGNFDAAARAWDQTKAAGAKAIQGVVTNAKQGAAAVVAIWSDKTAVDKAAFAGKQQGKAHQDGLTDEQKKALKAREKEAEKARKKEETDHKKHLADVGKANQKAIEDLAKLEADAHIASLKDEEQRDMVKIMAKRDLDAEEIMRGIQDEKLKNKQIAALDATMQGDITRLQAEHAEKRRKKAGEEEAKRLEVEKAILEQERQAENALLDWKELAAKNNAGKLADIQRERLKKQYEYTVDKLNAEEAVEKAKAAKEITDSDQLQRTLTAIEGKYGAERTLAEKKNADEKAKIETELKAKRQAIWGEVSGAFGALLKGDLSQFADYASKIVTGEKQAWQKRLEENQQKYAAVGAMAQQAAQFLADVAKQRADRAIAEIQRERDANIAALTEKVQMEQGKLDALEAEKQKIIDTSNNKIENLKSQTEKTVSDLEQQYRQLSTVDEKKKLDTQLDAYKENAEAKSQEANDTCDEAKRLAKDEADTAIKELKKKEKEAIDAATNEKEQKIDRAEATRDAEIASINKRTDVDQATRKQMIAEATARFELEKKQATDEAQHKVDEATAEAKTKKELAENTAKLKTQLAEDTRDAELKAIKAMQAGDTKAAKEIMERSKEDAREKIRLAKDEADKKIAEAEKEKKEKLKKVEQEAAVRKQNQKDLNRAIEDERARAAAKEKAEKLKAWQAQKKADIASAAITGALSVIKALASGFWPVNLVFAALAAVMTGIQIAKISSQPQPQFETGGFVAQGGRHGSSYGRGGIALVDRKTQREVGEMEGGEAIISERQTEANLPLIQQMFKNARTPGKRDKPVTSDRNAKGESPKPKIMQDGGVLDSAYYSRGMYLFGTRKAKRRDDEVAPYRPGSGMYEEGGYVVEGADAAASEFEETKRQGQEQIQLLKDIRAEVKANGQTVGNAISWMSFNLNGAVGNMGREVSGLKGSINAVEGAVNRVNDSTRRVEGAVWGTNQADRLNHLIWAISSFGGK